jgi:hypothetical protein
MTQVIHNLHALAVISILFGVLATLVIIASIFLKAQRHRNVKIVIQEIID